MRVVLNNVAETLPVIVENFTYSKSIIQSVLTDGMRTECFYISNIDYTKNKQNKQLDEHGSFYFTVSNFLP